MNQPGTSTGAIAVTVGTQAVTGPGVLLDVGCLGGSAAGLVTVYDGTSTGGLLLAASSAAIGGSDWEDFAQGIVFNTGLFVVVAGTGSSGVCVYRKNG